mmetsp:Transcript_21557/g.67624  ORF Transcript_21557/g.67624 Transcript_21557/m.67624 type:complete len:312 (-) Transcript_21557:349-1284(-)
MSHGCAPPSCANSKTHLHASSRSFDTTCSWASTASICTSTTAARLTTPSAPVHLDANLEGASSSPFATALCCGSGLGSTAGSTFATLRTMTYKSARCSMPSTRSTGLAVTASIGCCTSIPTSSSTPDPTPPRSVPTSKPSTPRPARFLRTTTLRRFPIASPETTTPPTTRFAALPSSNGRSPSSRRTRRPPPSELSASGDAAHQTTNPFSSTKMANPPCAARSMQSRLPSTSGRLASRALTTRDSTRPTTRGTRALSTTHRSPAVSFTLPALTLSRCGESTPPSVPSQISALPTPSLTNLTPSTACVETST